MAKLTFDEVLQLIADERHVHQGDVLASALQRKVWIAEWHIPGCLSESRAVCTSKADAVDSALFFAEDDNGAPRGMKTALQRDGYFAGRSPIYGPVTTTVTQHTLSEIL
jgi:hypothetical protein